MEAIIMEVVEADIKCNSKKFLLQIKDKENNVENYLILLAVPELVLNKHLNLLIKKMFKILKLKD